MKGIKAEKYSKIRLGMRTFYIRGAEELCRSELLELFSRSLAMAAAENYNAIEPLDKNSSLFIKARPLRHRNHRLKATLQRLGLGNGSPAMAEISNNLQIPNVSYIPDLIAFGYEKGRSGVIKKVFVATECCDNSVTLREFIETNPQRVSQAILGAFALIQSMLNDGITHLDFWLENVLTTADLSKLWLIDLEYCKVGSKAPLSDRLAFCIGYLYSYRLKEHIAEEDYFDLARSWLTDYVGADADFVLRKALLSVQAPLSRRDRLAVF